MIHHPAFDRLSIFFRGAIHLLTLVLVGGAFSVPFSFFFFFFGGGCGRRAGGGGKCHHPVCGLLL